MGRLDGKVAIVSGGAVGETRVDSHAKIIGTKIQYVRIVRIQRIQVARCQRDSFAGRLEELDSQVIPPQLECLAGAGFLLFGDRVLECRALLVDTIVVPEVVKHRGDAWRRISTAISKIRIDVLLNARTDFLGAAWS